MIFHDIVWNIIGGFIGAIIGIAMEHWWMQFRHSIRVSITAEYFDLDNEQAIYIYVWNKGLEAIPPFRMTLRCNPDAIPIGEPLVPVLSFIRDEDKTELLTNQRATFKLLLSLHNDLHYCCEMTSRQAELYSSLTCPHA